MQNRKYVIFEVEQTLDYWLTGDSIQRIIDEQSLYETVMETNLPHKLENNKLK